MGRLDLTRSASAWFSWTWIRTSREEDHGDGRRDEDGTTELLRKAEAEPGMDVLREGVQVLAEALLRQEDEPPLALAAD